MWSEVSDEVKDKLIKAVKNNLIACGNVIPTTKSIVKRIKGFYSNRRSIELLNADPAKKKKRKMEVKRNRMTYVSAMVK